jgi:hypothetical protein
VLGEVVWIDAAGARDQLHGSDRRPVVAVGQHVDVCMRHPAVVEGSDRVRESTIGEAALAHQEPQGLSERLITLVVQLDPSGRS